MCRRQAYDGAANMQDRRTGVATRISSEQPAGNSSPLLCLNLCLQDVEWKVICHWDALEISRDIKNLIGLSPLNDYIVQLGGWHDLQQLLHYSNTTHC